jgi:plasmid stabilization system protein ParE
MVARRVRLREHAAADIDEAVTYYLAEGGTDVATRFVDAIERSTLSDESDS